MSSPPSVPPPSESLPIDFPFFPPPPPKPVSVSPPSPPDSSGSPATIPSSPPSSPSSGESPQTPSSSSTSSGGLSAGVMVGIAIGGVAILVLVLTLIFFICKKKRRRDNEAPPAPKGVVLGIHQRTFTYEELSKATNKFSEANLLGEGGFGYVYKGIMTNGKEVAVKQLKAGSGQGDREFQAEVNIITRVHHKYLVSLLGYYAAGVQRLLVYEYVPNNNLEFHLHGKGRPPLEWSSRLKIAVGSAKGLSYLHENCKSKFLSIAIFINTGCELVYVACMYPKKVI